MGLSQKCHIVFCVLIMGCDVAIRPFVVDGAYTTISEFPHCSLLEIYCDQSWICGSSVVNQNILLTAAHCVDPCDLNNPDHVIVAYAGHENLDKMTSARKITTIRKHKNYNHRTLSNDIALLGFRKGFRLGQNIKRIIISPWFPKGRTAQVAGWGKPEEDTETLLKAVTQNIRSKKVCSQIEELDRRIFCAGDTRTDSHFLDEGDSGSALVTRNYVQIGIVSYRIRRLPTLVFYSNVSYYYKWISDNAKKLYCKLTAKNV